MEQPPREYLGLEQRLLRNPAHAPDAFRVARPGDPHVQPAVVARDDVHFVGGLHCNGVVLEVRWSELGEDGERQRAALAPHDLARLRVPEHGREAERPAHVGEAVVGVGGRVAGVLGVCHPLAAQVGHEPPEDVAAVRRGAVDARQLRAPIVGLALVVLAVGRHLARLRPHVVGAALRAAVGGHVGEGRRPGGGVPGRAFRALDIFEVRHARGVAPGVGRAAVGVDGVGLGGGGGRVGVLSALSCADAAAVSRLIHRVDCLADRSGVAFAPHHE
ncbi:bifunctional metallophosphatase/5'-nucleotidase [Babesia caballi]|uniref:Bifunctional metallophosphatase/5'-nucleotidase n=1 Tax=Babesia caballi TaxID=5871 RepID=A0AAV4LQI6_BABCB|nr:bifunctional metallophosphatase/5'-nucleotidase [Babesia caballi]